MYLLLHQNFLKKTPIQTERKHKNIHIMAKSYKNEKSVTSTLVNNLLNNVLPGISNNVDIQGVEYDDPNDILAQKKSNKFKNLNKKKHTVQLINDSLKKRALIDNIKQDGILKKQKQKLRKSIKQNTKDKQQLIQTATLQNLKEHFKTGNLTEDEQKQLNKMIKKEVLKLKQWDIDYELKDDLKELQHDILLVTDPKYAESLKRKQLKKNKSKKKSHKTNPDSLVNQYKGLTPGLAPVDMEDSDSEEFDDGDMDLPIDDYKE